MKSCSIMLKYNLFDAKLWRIEFESLRSRKNADIGLKFFTFSTFRFRTFRDRNVGLNVSLVSFRPKTPCGQ